jgi:hypothetical protein
MKSPVLKRLIDVLDAQLQHLDDDFSDRGPAGQQPGLTRVD